MSEAGDDLGRKVVRMAESLSGIEEEVGQLWDATDLANLDLDDLRNVVGRYEGIVRLTRIEFHHLAAVMLELCREVGVWPPEADALVEHVEHLIERP